MHEKHTLTKKRGKIKKKGEKSKFSKNLCSQIILAYYKKIGRHNIAKISRYFFLFSGNSITNTQILFTKKYIRKKSKLEIIHKKIFFDAMVR